MPEKRYWGSSNQYGPYNAQADGWPDAGQVMRDYRTRVKKLSAEALAQMYSEAIGSTEKVTGRRIQQMENLNQVPVDIKRRRAIAELLGIPAALFGLGALAELQFVAPKEIPGTGHTDITAHTKTLDLLWRLDHSSSAQSSLADMDTITAQLKAFASITTGKEQTQVLELLCGYYSLISTVRADLCEYNLAYRYADDAVTIARNIENNKLLAVAFYQRGFVSQEWGTSQEIDTNKLTQAIADYNAALPIATPKVQAHVYLDLAIAQAHLKRSSAADNALNKAGALVDRGNLDEGTFIDEFANLDKGRYRLGQAVVFTVLRRYDDASDLIFEAKDKMLASFTRRLAWAEATEAQIHYGQRNYALAATTGLQALKLAKSVNSIDNMKLISRLHTQLLSTNFKHQPTVTSLGAELLLP